MVSVKYACITLIQSERFTFCMAGVKIIYLLQWCHSKQKETSFLSLATGEAQPKVQSTNFLQKNIIS